ncbi:DUF4230 domain-containing protein [Niabella insulamsoli]|uniref:DUF4230 domain-containing protein n=1 Tax=Niabella insulamsoli TaxID=3144874 RepID=UPI0031FE1C64
MRSRASLFFVFLLIIVIAVLAYFLGKRNASDSLDNVVLNDVIIRQIAELSTLEARGNATIKSSNISNDGSLSDSFKKFFLERTFNISVPYVAKFGVNLGDQKVTIEEKNKQVYIVLPEPQLLSYELRLDQTNAVARKGLLESDNERQYDRLMQKLYEQSKGQLQENAGYRQRAKEKIIKILGDYYKPLGFEVDVAFVDDLKSSVITPPRQ